jgi:hypothetical protein
MACPLSATTLRQSYALSLPASVARGLATQRCVGALAMPTEPRHFPSARVIEHTRDLPRWLRQPRRTRALRGIAACQSFDASGSDPQRPTQHGIHLAIWQAGTFNRRNASRAICARGAPDLGTARRPALSPPVSTRDRGSLLSFEPALLVAMRKAGAIAAIQRIFLDPSTSAYTEKRVSVRLSARPGPTAPGKTIGICEGSRLRLPIRRSRASRPGRPWVPNASTRSTSRRQSKP